MRPSRSARRASAPFASSSCTHRSWAARAASMVARFASSGAPAAAGAPDDANLATIDAARAAHERCVQLLLANGADARRADRDGRIAADFAPREPAAAA